jgi:hypothetical protein
VIPRRPRLELPIPGSSDRLLLLTGDEEPKRFENLIRSRSDGSIVWRAGLPDLPGAADVDTDVRWRDGELHAFSWSCFDVTLDPETGRVLREVFTK